MSKVSIKRYQQTPNISEALKLHQQGHLSAAKMLYESIISHHPQHAEAIHLLGVIHLQTGDYESALSRLQTAAQLDPVNPFYLNNLGSAYLGLNNIDKAAECYQIATELKPDYVDAIANLADCLRDLGYINQAISYYQNALRLDNKNCSIYHNLASTYQHQNDFQKAVQYYQEALKINPNYAPSLNNLANILTQNGNTKDATALFQRILITDSNNIEARRNLGMCHVLNGELDKAETTFNQLLQLNKHDQKSLSELALIKGYQGATDEAESLCRQVLALNPTSIQALCTLADISRLDDINSTIKTMESLLDEQGIDTHSQIQLHFQIAQLYDKQEEYSLAFKHYRATNDLRKQLIGDFNFADRENRFQLLRDTISKEFLEQRQTLGNPSNTPIFVIGMPRSGTSLVEQILASHSQVFGAGELREFKQYATVFTDYKDPKLFKEAVESLNSDLANQLSGLYLQKLQKLSKNQPRVIDKLPHNFETVWLIRILFPNAKIIHCQRDPMDTCVSCYFTNFSKGHSYKQELTTLGKYYGLYHKLIDHWNDILPEQTMLNVSYEELIKNPEDNIRKMINFCDLDWEDACLTFYETKRIVKTASYTQVKEKLYNRSIGRWKNYEEFLAPLISEISKLNIN